MKARKTARELVFGDFIETVRFVERRRR